MTQLCACLRPPSRLPPIRSLFFLDPFSLHDIHPDFVDFCDTIGFLMLKVHARTRSVFLHIALDGPSPCFLSDFLLHNFVDSKKYNDFFSTVPLSMDQRFTMI
jgi:hypothetical protein